MIWFIKVFTAAGIIALSSWLAGKRPELAGFIIALPLASLLALAFAHVEHGNAQNSITFARSILVAVPVSWLFFAPFFFSAKLGDNFWLCYAIGLVLLGGGYFIHKLVLAYFF